MDSLGSDSLCPETVDCIGYECLDATSLYIFVCTHSPVLLLFLSLRNAPQIHQCNSSDCLMLEEKTMLIENRFVV
jgi:hypothetical protein